jgi:uridine kinase
VALVIAIGAISGGGKTTLVNKTADLMGAARMFFDDYFLEQHYPKDLVKWFEDGADLNTWKCQELTEALRKLKNGETIINPRTKEEVLPNDIIVLEEPTGKERAEIADLIDYFVVIDTPPEISLARRILRGIEPIPVDKLDEYPKEEILKGLKELIKHQKDDLTSYIEITQKVYITILKQTKVHADLILDWDYPAEELALKVKEFVENKQNSRLL